MEGYTLLSKLSRSLAELDSALEDLEKYGESLANAESDYKVGLMTTALKLKDDGMAVTLIQLTVYGMVAELRRSRDIAEAKYKTAQEKVNAIKLRCRLLDAQISREWGQAK